MCMYALQCVLESAVAKVRVWFSCARMPVLLPMGIEGACEFLITAVPGRLIQVSNSTFANELTFLSCMSIYLLAVLISATICSIHYWSTAPLPTPSHQRSRLQRFGVKIGERRLLLKLVSLEPLLCTFSHCN